MAGRILMAGESGQTLQFLRQIERKKMILKWQTLEGNWHFIDGVTNIINHGWQTIGEINDLATRYDGEDHILYWTLDGSSKAVESDTDTIHYVVATIHGEREHLIIQDMCTYVLSDQGKTVDRL